MRAWPHSALLLTMLTLAGCASYEAVKPNEPRIVEDRISVVSDVAWAEPKGMGFDDPVWTVDGLGLNELHFLLERKAGEPLIEVPRSAKKDFPAYKAEMLPNDVMELMVSSLGRAGEHQVRASGLAPVTLASGAEGFRFDLMFLSRDQLEMHGMVLGFEREGTLDLLLFVAPAEYYFVKMKPTVERLFQTVRLLPAG